MFLTMLSPHRKLFGTTLNICLRNLSTSSSLRKNHYEVLEVKRDATAAEIKNAYFRLSKMYHPDKIVATDENLKKFREISEAYEVLGNEHSRKLYDSGLLGEIKRVGMDVSAAADPIVEFYKQRQDMAKILNVKPDGIGVWTQSSFADAQKSRKHDLFSMKTTGGLTFQPLSSDYCVMLYCLVLAFLIMSSFEGTRADKLCTEVKNFINSIV